MEKMLQSKAVLVLGESKDYQVINHSAGHLTSEEKVGAIDKQETMDLVEGRRREKRG